MQKGPWAGQRQRSSMAWAFHHPPGFPGSWWEGRSRQWCLVQGVQLEQEAGSGQPQECSQEPLLSVSRGLSPGEPLWLPSSKASGLCLRLSLPGPVVRKVPTLVKSTGGVAGCGLWVPFCFAPSRVPSCTQCQPGEKNSSPLCSGPGLRSTRASLCPRPQAR